jgi:N-acetylglucosamine-6-phosphate deacetylase
MASTNPAALMGRQDCGRLQPGARADMIILNAALELKSVFIAGRELT